MLRVGEPDQDDQTESGHGSGEGGVASEFPNPRSGDENQKVEDTDVSVTTYVSSPSACFFPPSTQQFQLPSFLTHSFRYP